MQIRPCIFGGVVCMEIDVCDSVCKSKINFILSAELWQCFDNKLCKLINCTWEEAKFLDSNNNRHPTIDNLPTNKGGIYVFVARPNIIPNIHMYIMYIGRALNTPVQNLRKRCGEYYIEKRPKIRRMIDSWGQYLYIRYLPLDDNYTIEALEKELINKILPPFNDRIPDAEIQDAVKAFSV